MQGTGDLDLVRKIKAGDREAFGELVDRHQKAVYRLAVRFVGDYGVAEDIVQESFFKAFQKINLFEERSSFKSWLFRIAINTCKNRWRAKSYHDVNLNDIVVSVGERTTKQLEHDEIQEFLHQEVEKLPHKQKTALKLRVFEDLSFQDIAQIMSCPYDTAKANYRHAVLKLKAAFEPNNTGRSRVGWILDKEDGLDVQFLQTQRGE
jgi:RNA polymerase sigma-70 factor (ECF subfamily)